MAALLATALLATARGDGALRASNGTAVLLGDGSGGSGSTFISYFGQYNEYAFPGCSSSVVFSFTFNGECQQTQTRSVETVYGMVNCQGSSTYTALVCTDATCTQCEPFPGIGPGECGSGVFGYGDSAMITCKAHYGPLFWAAVIGGPLLAIALCVAVCVCRRCCNQQKQMQAPVYATLDDGMETAPRRRRPQRRTDDEL